MACDLQSVVVKPREVEEEEEEEEEEETQEREGSEGGYPFPSGVGAALLPGRLHFVCSSEK